MQGEMNPHIIPEFPMTHAFAAVAIAFVYISIFSWVKEPQRQTINALILAGAGSVYWSSGLGLGEFPLGGILIYLAYKGLNDYRYLSLGWLVHTFYDVLHHFYGNPIVLIAPSSSAGCAVCDPILALWLFYKAPSIFDFFKNPKTAV
jgi:hypothetical protein